MKKTILSKSKIQIEHSVPIYVDGFNQPIDNINMKVRYKWGRDYGTIPSSNGWIISISSVQKSLENIAFKLKLCNSFRIGNEYVIKGVVPKFNRKKIDDLDLNIVTHIMINDDDFIQKFRDKKLNDILSNL